MNKKKALYLYLAVGGAVLATTSINALANASANQRMESCKIAVLDKSEFRDLPMAAVSVFHGKDKKHPTFTVRWDGLKANGKCKVGDENRVRNVHIDQIHDGRHGGRPSNSWNDSNNDEGFYYDNHIGKWRDPEGRTCHTCTPDNGFPRGGYRYN